MSEQEEMLKCENVEILHRLEQLQVENKELKEKIRETTYTQQYVKGVFDTLSAIFGGGTH